MDNYPSVLSNQHKRQIQEYFIQYLKVLQQEEKLQDKVLDFSSNKLLTITDLNSFFSQIAVFETLIFIKPSILSHLTKYGEFFNKA